jgi:Mg2+ and Co2+ transporter CorA
MSEHDSAARMRGWLTKTGLTEEQSAATIEAMRDFVRMMAIMIENVEEAPNHITISYETPTGDDYELTIRKCRGMAPATKIALLEDEVARLKRRLHEASKAAL